MIYKGAAELSENVFLFFW